MCPKSWRMGKNEQVRAFPPFSQQTHSKQGDMGTMPLLQFLGIIGRRGHLHTGDRERKAYTMQVYWRRSGSSLPGLRMLDPLFSPPSTPAEFFRCICSIFSPFQAILKKNVFFLGKFILKNITPIGEGGVPFFFYPKSYFFCDLKLCAKFHNPRTTPSGRKVCGTQERRKKKKNNPKNIGHFVLLQRLRAAHALRSDQNMLSSTFYDCVYYAWDRAVSSRLWLLESLFLGVFCVILEHYWHLVW